MFLTPDWSWCLRLNLCFSIPQIALLFGTGCVFYFINVVYMRFAVGTCFLNCSCSYAKNLSIWPFTLADNFTTGYV